MPNWEATLAAVTARGPRCDRCGGFTFRPEYGRLPRFIARLCPDCLPLTPLITAPRIKALALMQVFRRDLGRYPADRPIRLGGE